MHNANVATKDEAADEVFVSHLSIATACHHTISAIAELIRTPEKGWSTMGAVSKLKTWLHQSQGVGAVLTCRK